MQGLDSPCTKWTGGRQLISVHICEKRIVKRPLTSPQIPAMSLVSGAAGQGQKNNSTNTIKNQRYIKLQVTCRNSTSTKNNTCPPLISVARSYLTLPHLQGEDGFKLQNKELCRKQHDKGPIASEKGEFRAISTKTRKGLLRLVKHWFKRARSCRNQRSTCKMEVWRHSLPGSCDSNDVCIAWLRAIWPSFGVFAVKKCLLFQKCKQRKSCLLYFAFADCHRIEARGPWRVPLCQSFCCFPAEKQKRWVWLA